MNKSAICLALLCTMSAPSAWAKKAPDMSPLQLQEMQSRTLETSKNVAFSAVMSVLQDSGYRIGSADKETGLITGIASTKTKMTWMPFIGFGSSKKTPVVSAFIEDIGPTATKIRLNFVMTKAKANGFGNGQDEEPILDVEVYRDAFTKIDQAIFIRQAAQSNTPSVSVPVESTAETTSSSNPVPAASIPQ